jgi:hypothetical protein
MGGPKRILALLPLVVLLPGCAQALLFNNGLYRHTIEPLTFNRNATDVRASAKLAKGHITELQYPLSSALSIRIGKNGIGDVAKAHGMTTVYYADLERRSVVFGLWSTEVVHIYGK